MSHHSTITKERRDAIRAGIRNYEAKANEMSEGGRYGWWLGLSELLRELSSQIDALDAAEAKLATAEPIGFVSSEAVNLMRAAKAGWHYHLFAMDRSDPKATEPLYAAPPAAPVITDYFGSLVERARTAAEKASRKFPQPNYVALKIAEEAGEVIRGCVHYAENRMDWSEVEGEIVQLLAMLIRLVTEGDQVNGVTPPALLASAPATPTPRSE